MMRVRGSFSAMAAPERHQASHGARPTDDAVGEAANGRE